MGNGEDFPGDWHRQFRGQGPCLQVFRNVIICIQFGVGHEHCQAYLGKRCLAQCPNRVAWPKQVRSREVNFVSPEKSYFMFSQVSQYILWICIKLLLRFYLIISKKIVVKSWWIYRITYSFKLDYFPKKDEPT